MKLIKGEFKEKLDLLFAPCRRQHAFKKRKKHASITAGSLSGKYFFRSAKITINPKTHKFFCLF